MAAAEEIPTKPCDHCDQRIIWAESLATGTRTPLDAAPSEQGNVLLSRGPGRVLQAGVASKTVAAAARAAGQHTYLHHAVSCPYAAAWQKPRKGSGRGGRAQRRPAP